MTAEELKEWDKSFKKRQQHRARDNEEVLHNINNRAPKKQQIQQVVMSHPEYKDKVKDMS
ncbi:hypothetical protein VNI00_017575 [Paramarasmius palmivorus]|uniref:Uncharacterized protein n=1 Tax=Paramarasmius palmivorus TaxID=297713 RepID=A0AAW0B618_9AGAR